MKYTSFLYLGTIVWLVRYIKLVNLSPHGYILKYNIIKCYWKPRATQKIIDIPKI